MTPEEIQAEYRRGLSGQCPQRSAQPAKPSPREVLRAILDALDKKRRDEIATRGSANAMGTRDSFARDFAYAEAQGIIRSMAGHLMEES
jgi:hypothetical protein